MNVAIWYACIGVVCFACSLIYTFLTAHKKRTEQQVSDLTLACIASLFIWPFVIAFLISALIAIILFESYLFLKRVITKILTHNLAIKDDNDSPYFKENLIKGTT